MDFQNRVGSKPGAGGLMSRSESNVARRERLRKLAMETIDIENDPYFMRNHLGSYECKLCLTMHTNEGSYLAHTQGKKHQASLARRAARDARDAEAAPARTGAGAGAGAATASRVRRTVVKIGRPGYKVTKIRDPQARQLGLLFEVTYPEVTEETKPRHRFMSAFEQHVEPPNSQYQYLLFAADPYETIAFKVQSREVDMRPGRFWSHWDPDTRKFTLQLFFRSPARGPPGPDASGAPTGANAVPTGTRINPLDPYLAPQQTARG